MKLSLALIIMTLIILTLTASVSVQDERVDLLNLANKDFKYIAKFNAETTAEDISEAVTFLKQYNSSINIIRTVNEITQNVSLEIKSKGVMCKSDNFGNAIILLNKNNICECAIGDKGAYIDSEK